MVKLALNSIFWDCKFPQGHNFLILGCPPTQMIWASSQENLSLVLCEQQRHRPACASVQTDKHLCHSRIGKYHIYTCHQGIFNYQLVSVAEETGLRLALSETLKTGFVATRLICCLVWFSANRHQPVQDSASPTKCSYQHNVVRPEFFYKLIYGIFFSDLGSRGRKKNK